MNKKLILASASTARFGVLKMAGITPKVLVSDLDEDKVISSLPKDSFQPLLQVSILALAKAMEVIKEIMTKTVAFINDDFIDCDDSFTKYIFNNELVLVACDSMLEFEGKMLGKPKDPNVAFERAMQMRGKTTILHTGHTVVKLDKEVILSAKKKLFTLPPIKNFDDLNDFVESLPLKLDVTCESTKVTFSNSSEVEIKAYVDTKEPLFVAGGFTIDGYGAAFIESIDGDYNNVIGVSPKTIRKSCNILGVNYTDLWD